ncbi:MAG: DsbA family protein [Candidatus Aenigmarchaeota archaeon]|nr:DsbA family protein [Candidatus Aenigmarchaeota archaeon]
MAEIITIKKSTFQLLIVSFVSVLLVASFLAGYAAGSSRITGQVTEAALQGPGQPLEQKGLAAKVSADDDPVKGDPKAAVTIIEFADFQCPFCGRFFQQTLPQVENDYIKTGKAKLVYRDFPLDSIHPQAKPAAEAAECAKEQGKFWEFHDKIFQNQQSLSLDSYKKWANELGLNTNQFNSCVDSNKYAAEVQKDFQDGSNVGVSGTPTFFIGNDAKGYQQIVGAQPYSVIKDAIEKALAG